MEIKVTSAPVSEVETDALLAIGYEDTTGPADLNQLTNGWVAEVYASGEFRGKANETAVLHRPSGLKAKRLVLIGAGKAGSEGRPVRRAFGTGIRAAKKGNCQTVAALVPDDASAAAAVEGIILGDWESDRYRTKRETKPITSTTILAKGNVQEAVSRAQVVAESQNFTRDLQNEPPNELGPMALAAKAQEMAASAGLECEVLDQDRMRQLGMGSLLAVAMGSAQPPALIVIRYKPSGAAQAKDHLGLVGKGVTFDTGGISIKPADNMDKMKYDMSGGAAMIGAMRAIAQLKPSIPVTAFIPTVENMPGSRAYRPGDIVKTLSGKTVEVLNTDAEGRLILNDALTYAKQLGCTHLVDAATLTGAIVVALGHLYTGVFSNNDEFRDKLLAAASRQGEKMWAMPLDDEFMELLKSPFADIGNIGGRWGGAITAAMFLKQFAEETPWIHLDIAGTASHDEGKPYAAKGASGIGVRTLVDLAMSW